MQLVTDDLFRFNDKVKLRLQICFQSLEDAIIRCSDMEEGGGHQCYKPLPHDQVAKPRIGQIAHLVHLFSVLGIGAGFEMLTFKEVFLWMADHRPVDWCPSEIPVPAKPAAASWRQLPKTSSPLPPPPSLIFPSKSFTPASPKHPGQPGGNIIIVYSGVNFQSNF